MKGGEKMSEDKKDFPVSAMIPDEDFEKLTVISKTDQRSIAWLVRKAVHEFLNKNGGKK